MNPSRLIHEATFARQTDSIDGNGRRQLALTTVATAHPCLVEGLKGRARNSLFGRVDNAVYTISWQDLVLRDGDLCTWNGKQYSVREILDDTTRPDQPYYTAVLQERPR